MNAPLTTYLHDHLAGADLAIELLTRLKQTQNDATTAALAAGLLGEVTEDRETLRRLTASLGSGSAGIKEVVAWLTDKALRLKLRAEADDPLGVFESLEFLALGTLGKLHLWRALQSGPGAEIESAGLNLADLILRAEAQHARLDERRLQLAASVLRV